MSNIKAYKLYDNLEDMISEGNLVILQAIRDYRDDLGVPFLGFVKLRLRYIYLERCKTRDSHSSLNEMVDKDGDVERIDTIVDSAPLIEDKVIHGQDLDELAHALSCLTQRQAQIIKLYYFESLSMVKIASSLGLHYQTVVKLRDRALDNLKNILQHHGKL